MATSTTPNPNPLPDPDHLPDDPALLKAMLLELLDALRASHRHSEQLQNRLDQLLRRLFGPRAERLDPAQLLLFAPDDEATPVATPTPPPADPTPRTRPTTGHGRGPLPAHLPRERRLYELTEAERLCPCCGQPRAVLGQEVSEQLDYVPASLRVIEHVRLRYACLGCEKQRLHDSPGVATPETSVEATAETPAPTPPLSPPAGSTFQSAALPAGPIPRGLPTAGLLAHVIVSKYGDHLPLYRQEQIFARGGVPLTRQTLCGWLPACADLCRPLYALMQERIWQGWVVGSDDTPVSVLEPGRGETRQGRVWVYVGDVFAPYLVYDYTPNRQQQGPQRFLRDYLGYFQADSYAGYNALYASRLVEVACWAHVRRKFYDARSTDPERALYALGVIRQLYAVEKQASREIGQRGLDREQGWWWRLRLRQEKSVPLLWPFQAWLVKHRDQVLPKSPIGEAIGYACNLGVALSRYTTQGYLSIDNNEAERALRAIAVGRKNFLFFGSDGGGKTAAVLYSLVQSCKRLHIEPWHYLRAVLERLPSCPGDRLEELLPDRWAGGERAAVLEVGREGGRSPPEREER
jgi:transposase